MIQFFNHNETNKVPICQQGLHALHIIANAFANALLNILITNHNNIRRNGQGLFTPDKSQKGKRSHYIIIPLNQPKWYMVKGSKYLETPAEIREMSFNLYPLNNLHHTERLNFMRCKLQ
jgi:hypothetical protein